MRVTSRLRSFTTARARTGAPSARCSVCRVGSLRVSGLRLCVSVLLRFRAAPRCVVVPGILARVVESPPASPVLSFRLPASPLSGWCFISSMETLVWPLTDSILNWRIGPARELSAISSKEKNDRAQFPPLCPRGCSFAERCPAAAAPQRGAELQAEGCAVPGEGRQGGHEGGDRDLRGGPRP